MTKLSDKQIKVLIKVLARKGVLEDWFDIPRPLDIRTIKEAIRGARAVIVHLRRKRVTILHRGARRDRPLPSIVQKEILRALVEKGHGFLVGLMPKVGKRSRAELRVIR